MAITAHPFPQFSQSAYTKLMSLNGVDTLKIALSNAAGPITLSTTGIQAASVFSDWTAIAAEITGTGYTAGGNALTGVTVSTTGNVTTLTATGGLSWTSATFSANQYVIYDTSTTPTANKLICFGDFGGSVSVTGSTFTITPNASGLLTATAT